MSDRRLHLYSALLGLVLAGALGLAMVLMLGTPGGAHLPRSFSPSFDKTVPASIEQMALTDEHGRRVSLASFRGRTVVLADFLTSCQEACPITTGALMSARDMLARDHLLDRVVFVEVTVDPQRDTPARLAAYRADTGVNWTLLTGSRAEIATFWRYFGASYWRVPEDRPAGIDWETGKAYTYDVDHSDDVFIIDAAGHERLLTDSMPNVGGRLRASLTRLLSTEGEHNLHHPPSLAWTPADLLGALAWVMHTSVPGAP